MEPIANAELSGLIDHVYTAAAEPEVWNEFLEAAAGALGAKSALLRTIDLRGSRAVVASHHHNLDPALQAEYCAYWVDQDPYLEALRRFPAGRMVTNDGLVDLPRFRETPFYRHYLRPLDNHYILGGYVERYEGYYTLVGFHRHAKGNPYTERERELVQLLAPHIRRAVRLQRTVSTEQGRAAAAEGALEALAVAAFLLDGQGRLLHANGPAQRLLQAASAVRARPGGRLTTASPGAALGELVARACRRARGGGAAGVETLLLRDGKPGEPERLAIAYPLPAPRTALREHWPRARVALYVGSLAETGLLSAEVLAQAYGLTPAEARLAAAVAGGRELGELSEEWAVSTQTLRTQLKAVFAKTGVRRQTELVRLLAGAPWRLAGTGATMEEG